MTPAGIGTPARTLIVVTGPTASGKTDLAINIARELACDIVSADSRQIYRDIPIGTAAPSDEQLQTVRHHLVQFLDLDNYYSAARFEHNALKLFDEQWKTSDFAVMCGGSMMYIDAVTNGIDQLPDISPAVRSHALKLYENGGLPLLHTTLRELDPEYMAEVDPNNHRRLIHAIEICMESGQKYSSLRTGTVQQRPFRIVKFAINHNRDALFNRINARVDAMIQSGLEEEARSVYHLRHLNSLNTVGYKEMFAMFDGLMDRDTAIARIAKNTRVYAKKQLTWMKRHDDIHMLNPVSAPDEAFSIINRIITQ